jgi:hypothetical protein
LFIEKQGFDSLLEHAEIARRYDLAIMSTKGMSVTAARQLVERLSEEGVTILVLRDFDKSGFTIVHTLRSDTRRYRFRTSPRVIDLGLRLQDVLHMHLQDEEVAYKGNKDPRQNLRLCGATEEECDFLVTERAGNRWIGKRVELNAMTSAQFIRFLERKLAEIGVQKVVPDKDILEAAYRRAWKLAAVQRTVDEAMQRFEAGKDRPPTLPRGLPKLIREKLQGSPESWDEVLWQIVRERRGEGPADRSC